MNNTHTNFEKQMYNDICYTSMTVFEMDFFNSLNHVQFSDAIGITPELSETMEEVMDLYNKFIPDCYRLIFGKKDSIEDILELAAVVKCVVGYIHSLDTDLPLRYREWDNDFYDFIFNGDEKNGDPIKFLVTVWMLNNLNVADNEKEF